MKTLKHKTIVVAGGTGNVGFFITKDLLHRGATVVVPSRSEENIHTLRADFSKELEDKHLENLTTFVGDIGSEEGAEELLEKITGSLGIPDAAIASLGRFLPAPSMLDVSVADLKQALNDYLIAHFVVARTFYSRGSDRCLCLIFNF